MSPAAAITGSPEAAAGGGSTSPPSRGVPPATPSSAAGRRSTRKKNPSAARPAFTRTKRRPAASEGTVTSAENSPSRSTRGVATFWAPNRARTRRPAGNPDPSRFTALPAAPRAGVQRSRLPRRETISPTSETVDSWKMFAIRRPPLRDTTRNRRKPLRGTVKVALNEPRAVVRVTDITRPPARTITRSRFPKSLPVTDARVPALPDAGTSVTLLSACAAAGESRATAPVSAAAVNRALLRARSPPVGSGRPSLPRAADHTALATPVARIPCKLGVALRWSSG